MRRFLLCLTLALSACLLQGESIHNKPAQISGILKDVFSDPTNPQYLFLYLKGTNSTSYIAVNHANDEIASLLENAIGSEISVSGLMSDNGAFFPTRDYPRPYANTELIVNNHRAIVIVKPTADNLATLPDDSDLLHIPPNAISTKGVHRVRGKVAVTWNGNGLLLLLANGRVVEANLRTKDVPRVGETIDLVGLPETTLYNLRFNRAVWRSVAPPEALSDEALPISAARIVSDDRGRPRMDIALHGKVIRVRGIVRRTPRADAPDDLLYIEDNGFLVAVNGTASAERLGDVQIGCTVEVTGVCVMNVDVWRPNAVFPVIHGYTLVTRTADDIRILARPPWLTPARMLAIVLSLLALLVGVFVWNRTLKILAERRGRQLAREQILRAESDLKVHERTRLAVELHDSLSQTLTGVAMEIRSADKTPDGDPERKRAHLTLASKTIDACREELRHCLWDLRNNALEAADMNEAIRQTLTPHIGDASLAIRFNVPRSAFTDNSAHAILRIIRELTANAIRHGHATEIHVAGAIEGGKLLFSVRDNGCGFDADSVAGPEQGHFGLQGIRERVATFDGEFTIESEIGHGSKVTIALNAPHTAHDALP